MSNKSYRTLAIALSLTLAGSALWAHPGEENDQEKKVEKHRIVVIDKDGKEQVFEGGGLLARRGFLGVGLTDLTPELRTHFGVPEDAGVMISKIEAGSPAEKAGLKVGDIVARLDGKDVDNSWEVRSKVRQYKDGEQVPLEVWRNGKAQTISLTVAERERPEIDMGPLLWKEEGGPIQLRMPELPGAFEMRRPGESGGAPGARVMRLRTPREAELEKRLAELEKRIDELEKQLKKQ